MKYDKKFELCHVLAASGSESSGAMNLALDYWLEFSKSARDIEIALVHWQIPALDLQVEEIEGIIKIELSTRRGREQSFFGDSVLRRLFNRKQNSAHVIDLAFEILSELNSNEAHSDIDRRQQLLENCILFGDISTRANLKDIFKKFGEHKIYGEKMPAFIDYLAYLLQADPILQQTNTTQENLSLLIAELGAELEFLAQTIRSSDYFPSAELYQAGDDSYIGLACNIKSVIENASFALNVHEASFEQSGYEKAKASLRLSTAIANSKNQKHSKRTDKFDKTFLRESARAWWRTQLQERLTHLNLISAEKIFTENQQNSWETLSYALDLSNIFTLPQKSTLNSTLIKLPSNDENSEDENLTKKNRILIYTESASLIEAEILASVLGKFHQLCANDPKNADEEKSSVKDIRFTISVANFERSTSCGESLLYFKQIISAEDWQKNVEFFENFLNLNFFKKAYALIFLGVCRQKREITAIAKDLKIPIVDLAFNSFVEIDKNVEQTAQFLTKTLSKAVKEQKYGQKTLDSPPNTGKFHAFPSQSREFDPLKKLYREICS